jgi:hypothetical protein
MSIETGNLNKKELTIHELDRQVRKGMGFLRVNTRKRLEIRFPGKSAKEIRQEMNKIDFFTLAFTSVCEKHNLEPSYELKSKLGSLSGEVSGATRAKMPVAKSEPAVQGPHEDLSARAERIRKGNIKSANPMFSDYEEGMLAEKARRDYH